MAGLSGLCPQRRVFKGVDPQAKKLLGELSKDMVSLQSLESFKGEPEVRQGWWSSQGLLRMVIMVLGSLLVLSTLSVYGSGILLIRANDLGRQCIHVRKSPQHSPRHFKFAMVTCSDGSKTIPQRSFEGLMELVTPNKKSYVERHGYEFIDASDVLDKDRPPSWSKILAVNKHLPDYDWVFWNDADSVVTNPAIALEDIIYSVVGDVDFNEMPDFIITEDVTGVNAGMFFFRNSEWSRHFLDLWWNQTDFVKPFGECKSGDNGALKHLIQSMPQHELKLHVRIPRMQCLFNSNLWRPSWRSSHRLVTLTKSVWQGVYAKGDFMVHLAGLNDKKKWIKRVIRDIAEENDADRDRGEGRTLITSRKEGLPPWQQ